TSSIAVRRDPLNLANGAYVLEKGLITLSDTGEALLAGGRVRAGLDHAACLRTPVSGLDRMVPRISAVTPASGAVSPDFDASGPSTMARASSASLRPVAADGASGTSPNGMGSSITCTRAGATAIDALHRPENIAQPPITPGSGRSSARLGTMIESKALLPDPFTTAGTAHASCQRPARARGAAPRHARRRHDHGNDGAVRDPDHRRLWRRRDQGRAARGRHHAARRPHAQSRHGRDVAADQSQQ